MRVLFFGSPAFAVPSLEAIAAAEWPIAGVVTQPDRPRGRGQRVSPGAVKVVATALGVPILQPETLSAPGLPDTLAALGADIGVVAAYGQLLPDWLLRLPARGMVNVHASLLPRYRGAAPVHRAILAGERETGVTIMRVVKKLDAGPMLDRVVVPIGEDETSEALEATLAVAGAALLVSVLERLAAGEVQEVPQRDEDATYAAGSCIIHGQGTTHRVVSDDGCVVLAVWLSPVRFDAE
jgi:methionyl-tRNA formyltransferase